MFITRDNTYIAGATVVLLQWTSDVLILCTEDYCKGPRLHKRFDSDRPILIQARTLLIVCADDGITCPNGLYEQFDIIICVQCVRG